MIQHATQHCNIAGVRNNNIITNREKRNNCIKPLAANIHLSIRERAQLGGGFSYGVFLTNF